MPFFPENFGLGFLNEDDQAYAGFLRHTCEHAKMLPGYFGAPYLFMPMGGSEFWIRTVESGDGNLRIAGVDSHCKGKCVWKLAATDIELKECYSDPMQKLMIFNNYKDGTGMLPIHIINPDVLPGPLAGDQVVMQVVALPEEIRYYADEEEFLSAQPKDDSGRTWAVANGALFPAGFMFNHATVRPEEEKDYSMDDLVQFTGTVKGLYQGIFELEGKSSSTFIRCLIDTKFGKLELCHTYEQVPEELRKNMYEGAIVSGSCVISGDVAIYEYKDGMVKDQEHDLRALRYSFVHGEAERLYSILAENAVYCTDSSRSVFEGAGAIVERLKYVHENHKGEYFAHMATITSFDGEEEPAYPVGTRCVVLADNEERNYESVAFIRCDKEGMITNIDIRQDSRYHFRTDEKRVYTYSFDDAETPGSEEQGRPSAELTPTQEQLIQLMKKAGVTKEDASVLISNLETEEQATALLRYMKDRRLTPRQILEEERRIIGK